MVGIIALLVLICAFFDLVKNTCVFKHHFYDNGKSFVCTKCGLMKIKVRKK